ELALARLPKSQNDRQSECECIWNPSHKSPLSSANPKRAMRQSFHCWRALSLRCLHRSKIHSPFVMLSAVIFALDGVLADSETCWSQIDAKLLAEYGATYHGEHHKNVIGVSYRIVVEFYKK